MRHITKIAFLTASLTMAGCGSHSESEPDEQAPNTADAVDTPEIEPSNIYIEMMRSHDGQFTALADADHRSLALRLDFLKSVPALHKAGAECLILESTEGLNDVINALKAGRMTEEHLRNNIQILSPQLVGEQALEYEMALKDLLIYAAADNGFDVLFVLNEPETITNNPELFSKYLALLENSDQPFHSQAFLAMPAQEQTELRDFYHALMTERVNEESERKIADAIIEFADGRKTLVRYGAGHFIGFNDLDEMLKAPTFIVFEDEEGKRRFERIIYSDDYSFMDDIPDRVYYLDTLER